MRRGTHQCRRRVTAMRLNEMVGADVGHACYHQRRTRQGQVVVGPRMVQYHVLVDQHLNTQSAQLIDPGQRAGVILVVARDKKAAVARKQTGKRCYMGRKLSDRAIHQVTRNGHHVGVQCIHAFDNAPQVLVADRRADVNIRYLRHGKAVQGRRQAADRYVYPHHPCSAPRAPEPPGRGGQREHGNRSRAIRLQGIE